jgi:serine/threonine protein kinase
MESSENQNQKHALLADYVDPDKHVLRILNQRYELREELGRGAHGRIYSGKDKVLKTGIAVKLVSQIR